MSEVRWPKVDRFLSEDEIVDVLFERLKNDKGAKQFVDDGPTLYHHGFGTAMRGRRPSSGTGSPR